MMENDMCEVECNYEACNYGNYYRCFPIEADYLTDCSKLHNLSLFKIGDNAYIDPADEYNILGFNNIPDDEANGSR